MAVIPSVRICEIRTEPLEAERYLRAVADPAAGGHDIFIGSVRDHADGRSVLRLEYSAHPSASEQLEQVANEVAGEFDLVALAVGHRVGTLEIGDLAVVCAVSAAHRDVAFDACRALIDRLKERVPIWKNEFFADGTSVWVGTP